MRGDFDIVELAEIELAVWCAGAGGGGKAAFDAAEGVVAAEHGEERAGVLLGLHEMAVEGAGDGDEGADEEVGAGLFVEADEGQVLDGDAGLDAIERGHGWAGEGELEFGEGGGAGVDDGDVGGVEGVGEDFDLGRGCPGGRGCRGGLAEGLDAGADIGRGGVWDGGEAHV